MKATNNKIPVLMLSEHPEYSQGGIVTVANVLANDHYLNKLVEYNHILIGKRDGTQLQKICSWISGLAKLSLSINKASLIHIHHSADKNFLLYSLLVRICSILKKKVVLHNHAADFKVFYNNESERVKKWITNTFTKATLNIVLSSSWLAWYQQIAPAAKWTILKNCISLPVINNVINKNAEGNTNILFLGIMNKRKGIFDLLEILPEIITEFPETFIFLAGNGEIESVKEIVGQKKLTKNVEVVGWVNLDQKIEHLQKCQIYVLPSYNEGLPMALLEAMAYGLVPVITNVGGISEVVVDGKNGFLIEPGDLENLKSKLMNLIEDSKLRSELSGQAVKTVSEKHSMASYTKDMYKIYQNVLNNSI